MVLGPVAEATRTPDEITLAATQSFPSQLSGFLSLLLLKRCFEIWLPFEVSRVQHDIYLRYSPNPLAFQIPSALSFSQNHCSPFPESLIHCSPVREGHQSGAGPGRAALPGPAGPARPRRPQPVSHRVRRSPLEGSEGEEKSPLLRRRQSAE